MCWKEVTLPLPTHSPGIRGRGGRVGVQRKADDRASAFHTHKAVRRSLSLAPAKLPLQSQSFRVQHNFSAGSVVTFIAGSSNSRCQCHHFVSPITLPPVLF